MRIVAQNNQVILHLKCTSLRGQPTHLQYEMFLFQNEEVLFSHLQVNCLSGLSGKRASGTLTNEKLGKKVKAAKRKILIHCKKMYSIIMPYNDFVGAGTNV